ncbi:MAG TPA: DUF4097 family beta strand repeat-containing protein [Bryobacteraceae bacterium]|nr:DUF4097 family beta strand repeat-containing protein [Bryobacteraceae bacterium]
MYLKNAIAFGLLAISAGCGLDQMGRVSSDFHYSYDLKPGGSLSVETFNGSAEITGWDQDTVDISGTKYAPANELLASLRIDIDHTPDSVDIHAARPSDSRGNYGARFVIKVPRTTIVNRVVSSNGPVRISDVAGPSRLRTSNGPIRVHDVHGGIQAQTGNGAIELAEVDGEVEAHTTNGAIRANLAASGPAARPVRLETTNGGIDLTLPSNYPSDIHAGTTNGGITLHVPGDLNARLSARTTNSSVSSDFQVKAVGEISRRRLEGTIGSGGPQIELTTTNGGIHLRKL